METRTFRQLWNIWMFNVRIAEYNLKRTLRTESVVCAWLHIQRVHHETVLNVLHEWKEITLAFSLQLWTFTNYIVLDIYKLQHLMALSSLFIDMKSEFWHGQLVIDARICMIICMLMFLNYQICKITELNTKRLKFLCLIYSSHLFIIRLLF